MALKWLSVGALLAYSAQATRSENQGANVKTAFITSDGAVNITSEGDASTGEEPPWSLNFMNVPCYLSDDLKQLGPFDNAFSPAKMTQWSPTSLLENSAWVKDGKRERMISDGRNIAMSLNCKLCNINVKGSVLPFTIGKTKPFIHVKVSCAARKDTLREACFTENGRVGYFPADSFNEKGHCAPCPSACDAGCEQPSNFEAKRGYGIAKYFKCKVRDLKGIPFTIAPKVTGDNTFMMEDKFKCDLKRYSKTAGLNSRPPFEGLYEGLDGDSGVPDVHRRKDFEINAEYKMWCQYMEDSTAGLSEDVRSPAYVDTSRWRFNAGLTRCIGGKSEEITASLAEGARTNGFLQAVTGKVSELITEIARKSNCAVCEVQFGGLMSASTEEASAAPVEVSGDRNTWSLKHEKLWVKSGCASESLGINACNRNLGEVGWSTGNPCYPCPRECMSPCENTDNPREFKCKLLPMVTFPSPTLLHLTDSVGSMGNGMLYKLPKVANCKEIQTRTCSKWSKKNQDKWCATWAYKTTCVWPDSFPETDM